MKYKYFPIYAVLFFLLGISCQKSFLDKSVNVDPGNPSVVPIGLQLSSAESYVSYNTFGITSQYTSELTQQITGVNRQAATRESYIFSTADFDNIWQLLYADCMENLTVVNSRAVIAGDLTYAGISNVLFVYTLGMVTDLWGDVPYSQAFKGDKNLTPVFDSQQSIYISLLSKIDSAISELSSVTPGNNNNIATYDLIFGGDPKLWLNAAYLIKARLYLHLSKVDPNNYQNVIKTLTGNGLNSSKEDMVFYFGTSDNNSNPWYQYNTQRGDDDFKGYLPDLANKLGDPRLAVYLTSYTPGHSGTLGNFYGSSASPIYLATFAEQNFILSEAFLKTSNFGNAQIYLQKGIKASFNQLGIDTATSSSLTYLGAQGVLSSNPDTALKQIMQQKYIALYLNPEVFTDWRRTGYPSIIPTTGSAIPRRFLYPFQEYSYNAGNVPANVTLYTPVYWDKQ